MTTDRDKQAPVTVSLPPHLIDEVDDLAAGSGWTRSEAVEDLLEAGFRHFEERGYRRLKENRES